MAYTRGKEAYMLKSIFESQLGLGLFAITVFIILLLPFELTPKLKNNKKIKIIVMISLLIIFAIIFISQAILLNPKVEAIVGDDYIQFKEEKVFFNNIEKIQYLENVDLEVSANGFRWGNDDYYSGDANVEALSREDDSTLLDIYKGKVYIDRDVDDYIVITSNNPSKVFIFNYNTIEKTKTVFNELEKKGLLEKE